MIYIYVMRAGPLCRPGSLLPACATPFRSASSASLFLRSSSILLACSSSMYSSTYPEPACPPRVSSFPVYLPEFSVPGRLLFLLMIQAYQNFYHSFITLCSMLQLVFPHFDCGTIPLHSQMCCFPCFLYLHLLKILKKEHNKAVNR